MSKLNGEDHLSVMDIRLWSLHQDILLRYGINTIFKWQRCDFRDNVAGYLIWLVPYGLKETDALITWLEYELETLKEDATKDFPGFKVVVSSDILLFKGIVPYMDRDTTRKLSSNAMRQFQNMLNDLTNKKGT